MKRRAADRPRTFLPTPVRSPLGAQLDKLQFFGDCVSFDYTRKTATRIADPYRALTREEKGLVALHFMGLESAGTVQRFISSNTIH